MVGASKESATDSEATVWRAAIAQLTRRVRAEHERHCRALRAPKTRGLLHGCRRPVLDRRGTGLVADSLRCLHSVAATVSFVRYMATPSDATTAARCGSKPARTSCSSHDASVSKSTGTRCRNAGSARPSCTSRERFHACVAGCSTSNTRSCAASSVLRRAAALAALPRSSNPSTPWSRWLASFPYSQIGVQAHACCVRTIEPVCGAGHPWRRVFMPTARSATSTARVCSARLCQTRCDGSQP